MQTRISTSLYFFYNGKAIKFNSLRKLRNLHKYNIIKVREYLWK